MGHSHLVLT
jgi:hypothetical protein